jgi:hypothetical protein
MSAYELFLVGYAICLCAGAIHMNEHGHQGTGKYDW